ncbi:TM2 domain-containing protein [Arthrobacter rhizosphaerae]|uniref:TM2 domain-containing protein n=1 Tax=Arthrobacter rhizosphaerae TaxID=2855490 RepID=UPI001FF0E34A|nr:TM2 domain-containing protein [Arthrobacter rhizosphaerae]
MTHPSAENPADNSESTAPASDQSAPVGQSPYPPQAPHQYQAQQPPAAPAYQQPPAAPAYQQPPAEQPQYLQPPAAPQYQAYPPAAPQQYQGQYPQMSQQPPMPNQAYGYPQPKSKIAAGLLGIFLGGLGIHRFYLGYTTIGVIQLVLTVVVGIFTLGLVGLWGVVEGIMILAGASYFQRDAKGIPLRE